MSTSHQCQKPCRLRCRGLDVPSSRPVSLQNRPPLPLHRLNSAEIHGIPFAEIAALERRRAQPLDPLTRSARTISRACRIPISRRPPVSLAAGCALVKPWRSHRIDPVRAKFDLPWRMNVQQWRHKRLVWVRETRSFTSVPETSGENRAPSSYRSAIAAVLSDMDAEIAALERRRAKTRFAAGRCGVRSSHGGDVLGPRDRIVGTGAKTCPCRFGQGGSSKTQAGAR